MACLPTSSGSRFCGTGQVWSRCASPVSSPTRRSGGANCSRRSGARRDSFPSGRFLNPPRVDVFYTAPAGNTRVVQARVIPGTITATGCSVQAVMVGGATGASTITVQYYAEEWW
jgi:hypothetical protein